MSNAEIIALQAKIAFMEDALEKLSDEYFQQQQALIKVQKQQAILIERIKELSQDGEQGSLDEKPPHY